MKVYVLRKDGVYLRYSYAREAFMWTDKITLADMYDDVQEIASYQSDFGGEIVIFELTEVTEK